MKNNKIINYAQLLLGLTLSGSVMAQNFSPVAIATPPALTNARSEWVDFNNDGRPDLFVAGTTTLGSLHTSVYISNGNNTFNSIGLTALADIAIDFNDYNRDGWVDILTSGINAAGVKKTIIYKNSNGSSFTAQPFAITNLSKGGIVWDDLDNDGDVDVLLSGLDASNVEQTLLFEFNNNTYTAVNGVTLPQVSNGQLKSFDANNDGLKEVLITGLNSDGLPVAPIYTFNKNLQPILYDNSLAGSAFNSISIQDYNNDGFPDLMITGQEGDNLTKKTRLLQNNGVNGFVNMNINFENLSSSSIDAADLDNDGLTDIILTGIDDGGLKYFKYYKNSLGFTFTDIPHSLNNIYNGDVALSDYDNDGDLDLFQIGNSDINFQANLFASDQSSTLINNPPTVPANVATEVSGDSVLLSWDKSTDDHTASNSVSYNIYVSKNPNGQNQVVSPIADLTTGRTKNSTSGNAGFKNSKKIHNLPDGRYYWGVQSVDNAYNGSAYTTEKSFAICNPISLGSDTVICFNDRLHLEMGSATDDVNWYSKTNGLLLSHSNIFEQVMTVTDTIIVQLIRPYNCEVRDTLIVKVAPLPEYDLGNDTAACSGQSFSLNVTTSFDSLNWFNPDHLLLANSTRYEYKVMVKDTIIVQLFNQYKCVGYDSIIVDVHALPQFDLGNDRDICKKEKTLFDLTGTPGTIDWSSTQRGVLATNKPDYLFQVIKKDTIIAKVTDVNQCVNYDSLVVRPLALPVIDLGENTSICYKEDLPLQIAGTWNQVKWFTSANPSLASNTNSYLWHVTKKDTVVVEVKDNLGCLNRDSIIVAVLPLPQFDLGRDTAICYQKRILLKAGAGFQRVDWYSKSSNQIINANNWFFDYKGLNSDIIIAKAVSTQNCVNYDSIKIDVNPLPVFSLGNDRQVCDQDTVKLSVAGAWSKVNWFTTGDIVLKQANASYQFKAEQSLPLWAEVFTAKGCVQYDTVNVNVLVRPVFDLGVDKVYCSGDEVALSPGNVGNSFAWTNSKGSAVSTDREYKFKGIASDKFTLRVTDSNQCQFLDSVFVKVNELPDFAIIGVNEVCDRDSVKLSVNNTAWKSLIWYKSQTDTLSRNQSAITQSLHQTTTFFARLKDQNLCEAIRSHQVIVNERPQAKAGVDMLLCYGENAIIGESYPSTSGLSFKWTPNNYLDNAIIANPVAKPDKPMTYNLVVTDLKNCSSSDSVYIEVNPKIIIDAGSDKNICMGESITLGGAPTASGSKFNFTYQWTSDTEKINNNSTSNPQVKPSATALYYVMVSSGKCSIEIDSIKITVNPLPQIGIIEKQSIGAGESRRLFATGGTTYKWTPVESLDNSSSDVPIASPLKTTTYSVTVMNENKCSNQAQVEVIVQNSLFIPSLFTPNGDGSNDLFKLYGSGVERIALTIYDQQGNKLFQAETMEDAFAKGWDGSSGGKTLTNDIYLWTIDGTYFNGEKITYNGATSGIVKLMK